MVLRSIKGVITLPKVSMPKVKGVTSRSSTSLTSVSPAKIAACTAAPIATHSIGSTPRATFCPKIFSINFCTMGILVGPPTKITFSMSCGCNLASDKACSTECRQRSTMGFTSSSNLVLVIFISKCFGPSEVAVINGKLISVSKIEDNSILAFSTASLTRCIAILSDFKSTPFSFLNSPIT